LISGDKKMKKDSQDGLKTTEQPDDIINEFSRISQITILEQYEAKNRDRINSSSLIARDAFDKLWLKITGKNYYQPVTTTPMPTLLGKNDTARTDPKGRNYCASITFSSVSWQKLPRRRIGKKFKDLFNIKGIEKNTGEERPIYQNQDAERLATILSVEAKDQMGSDAKTKDHGDVEGPFDIQVEGYWQVIFSPQQGPNDKKDVQLMWEGQCLIIKRMEEVILPGFYIEVADNALRDNFTQEPGKGRKKVGTIQEFPYTTIREATRQQYLEQKAAGDKIQREKLMREENA
jgi:hypothetical protein